MPVPPVRESATRERAPVNVQDTLLLGALLSSQGLAVLRMDAAGVLRALSPAAQRLLPEGAVGRPEVELLHRGVGGTAVLLDGDGAAVAVRLDAVDLPGAAGRLLVLGDAAPAGDELQARFDRSPLPQCRVDTGGLLLAVNPAMEALLGASQDVLRGTSGLEVFAGPDRSGASASLARLVAGEVDHVTHERTLVRRDGGQVRVSVTAAVVRAEPAAPYLAVSVQDLTPLRAAQQAVNAGEARLNALLRHATDVVVVVSAAGRLVYVSPAVTDRLGYEPLTMLDTFALELNHPADVASIRAAFARVQASAGAVEVFECRVRHADGSWRWTEQRYTNLLEDRDVRGVVVNLREITEQRRAEQDLRTLAVRDSLTGLANRTLLLDRLEQAIGRGRRSGEQVGLVLLDVVRMRGHNDRLGHAGGDALLIVLAGRLTAAADPTDSVARLGQDEFAVIVEDVTSTEDLRVRAAALMNLAAEPLVIDGQQVVPVMRAGVALTPTEDGGALLAAAERSLRAEGPQTGLAVLPGDDDVAYDELALAVRDGQLRVHYQPVLRLTDGGVAGVEALVRWQHPTRGLLGPVEFVPFAEACGLVVEVGEWVLREACAAQAGWAAAGHQLLVGVNLSPRQLAVPGFGELVREVLTTTGVPASSLVLEVTESALMDDDRALATLAALHELGVLIALDDFGTGYSSLTYLKRFPVNALKIDRSFVSGLGRDRDDEAIVASVVNLARSIGKGVIAEGVETPGQLEALRAMGVDEAQGFLWSRPVPADELVRWLAARQPVDPGPVAVLPPTVGVPAVGRAEERIAVLQAEGASLQTIAAALNAERLLSPSGGQWHTRSVARVVVRLPRPARR